MLAQPLRTCCSLATSSSRTGICGTSLRVAFTALCSSETCACTQAETQSASRCLHLRSSLCERLSLPLRRRKEGREAYSCPLAGRERHGRPPPAGQQAVSTLGKLPLWKGGRAAYAYGKHTHALLFLSMATSHSISLFAAHLLGDAHLYVQDPDLILSPFQFQGAALDHHFLQSPERARALDRHAGSLTHFLRASYLIAPALALFTKAVGWKKPHIPSPTVLLCGLAGVQCA